MERELWKLLYLIAIKLDKPWGHWKYSTADIVVVYLWCVICDRPMCWGVEKAHWPADLCPAFLPSQATLSRRMNDRVVYRWMQLTFEEDPISTVHLIH